MDEAQKMERVTSRNLTTPLYTKFEVSTLTQYDEHKKGDAKCINWGGLGVKGPKVIGNITIR